jgi:uncharacterized protein
MLIRFTVSNFLSFKDETEFNMLTGEVKRHPHHVYKREHFEVLRAAAIYGANGAGKSNLIKAISFLKVLILGGDVLNSYEKFKLSKESSKKTSEMGIEFEINETTYAYGIVFDHSRIVEEWLYKVNFNKGNDEMIFERKTDDEGINKLNFSAKYTQTEKDKYFIEFYEKELLTPSKSFISTTKNEHFEEIASIKEWFFENIIVVLPNYRPSQMYGSLFIQPELRALYSKMMAQFDTGLVSIDFKKKPLDAFDTELINKEKVEKLEKTFRENPKNIRVETGEKSVNIYSYENGKIYQNELICYHEIDGEKIELSLDEQSDGTIRLLDFLTILFLIGTEDKVFIIDEIDQSIHPSLSKEFTRLLMEMQNLKGQIIFTTHESNLLDFDIFRQDEIWFAEKDEDGATKFHPLSDFKIRYDLDVRKGYLNGRFGAIPFLGKTEKLNWDIYA